MRILKKSLYASFFALFGVAASGAAQAAESPFVSDPTIIKIGDSENVMLSDLRQYVAGRVDLKALMGSSSGIGAVAEELAMTRVLMLEGVQKNMPRLKDSSEKYDDVYALSVYASMVKECKAPEAPEAIKAFYLETPEAFRLPAQVRLNRLVVRAAEDIDKYTAKDWLGLQANAMAMGSTDMDRLVARAARLFPDLKQGDTGWVLLEGEQPIVKALAQSQEGDYIGPLKDGDYLYLMQVTGKRESRLLDWDVVKAQVPKRMVDYCRQSERARVRHELFNKYNVRIEDKIIDMTR